MVNPSSCLVKGGIRSSRKYLLTYLIPTLVHWLMAHPLTLKQLGPVRSLIWRYIQTPDNSPRLSPKLTPRVKYGPRAAGGLASQYFMYSLLQDTVNLAIRYLSGDGPTVVYQALRSFLLDTAHSVTWVCPSRLVTVGIQASPLPKPAPPADKNFQARSGQTSPAAALRWACTRGCAFGCSLVAVPGGGVGTDLRRQPHP